jgi:outer membrane protein with beta-barrel domain
MPCFKFAVTFCFLFLLTLIPQKSVLAQQEIPKFEVGAQFSVLGRRAGDDATSIGGGVRLTFNLNRYLALEGELNYFPSAGFNDVRRFQGQFGVKSGLRFNRVGVFGKVRPGFINTKYEFRTFCPPYPIPFPCPPGTVCIIAPCFPGAFTVADTDLSLDVGGVIEFYPSKLVTVRFDVGDTVVNRSFATHNLQLGAGVGFRF